MPSSTVQPFTSTPTTTEPPMTESPPSTERAPLMGVRAALDHAVSSLGHDEQRVLTRIAARLAHGATTYGPLDLASDRRSFTSKEAREEIEDALVYFACAWLKSEEVPS